MSIFNRMKAKRDKDMGIEEQPTQPTPQSQPPQTPVVPPQYTQPQPQPPQQKKEVPMPTHFPDGTPYNPPTEPPKMAQQSLYEKLTTKEIQEEILTITDEEKREFIFIFEDKYRTLYKEMNQILMKIEDVKISEKQKLEEHYRKQTHQIDEKYEQQKKIIEEKYSKHLERFKALSDKFKEHVDIGGLQDEIRPRTKIPEPRDLPRYSISTPPGPEIDQNYVNPDRADPEISRLIRELDEKLESRSLLKSSR